MSRRVISDFGFSEVESAHTSGKHTANVTAHKTA
jgi:hypothetical protein